ncbi:MAG: hypothetical protein ACLP9D_10570 [Candidatus Bathyarchaeia archaeon]
MKRKLGLLGLGGVAQKVLLQTTERDLPFKLYWVADSKRFVAKKNGRAFTKTEVHRLIHLKRHAPFRFEERCRKEIVECVIYQFEKVSSQAKFLREVTSELRHNWIILDTTSSKAEVGLKIAAASMGCLTYCTANKTPWATYENANQLYHEAERAKTLLGLNCTVGVWVDEMETIPILTKALKKGSIEILKRDNSSINFFLEKTYKGRSASTTFSDLASKGLLEPEATDLSVEIKDQVIKANIVANIAGIILHTTPICNVELSEAFSGSNPHSLKNIADWHRAGRRKGLYPALLTKIRIDADRGVHSQVKFDDLPSSHPLAKDLHGRNAFSLEASADAQFEWSFDTTKSTTRTTLHVGGGNESRTAAKLLWEAKRAETLFKSCSKTKFSPLPILWGLAARDLHALRLENELASRV